MTEAAIEDSRGPDRGGTGTPVIAVIGNPNTGKSTLFNALSGLRQKTGNYPGVTVERHTGTIDINGQPATLVDLPGTYSVAAQSPDEIIATDVLLGHIEDLATPSVALVVADATNLRRNLFLVSQLTEIGLPVVVAITMTDRLAAEHIEIDWQGLNEALGVRAVPIVATTGQGLDELRAAISESMHASPAAKPLLTDVWEAAGEIERAQDTATQFELYRALIDTDGVIEQRLAAQSGESIVADLVEARDELRGDGPSLAAREARERYRSIQQIVQRIEQRGTVPRSAADRLDALTNHPVLGIVIFVAVMACVFQAVFSWAGPLMEAIDATTAAVGNLVAAALPPGAIASLIVDGVIAGVGSVVIFLPQILILFAFIIFLEDSGYMPRVAFMIDRLMRSVGLSGQAFLPMLSSFACAVPGIMATRVIPNPRDRIATILAAPLMTCAARLPVYALLIAAFVPEREYLGGFINLQGLVLFGLYMLGIVGGIFTAFLLKRTALRGPTPSFVIEMPPYRLPGAKSLGLKLLDRGKIFLRRAGTIIFTVAVIIWALAYFPRSEQVLSNYQAQRTEAAAALSGATLERTLAELDQQEAAALLEKSALGTMGKTVAPVFAPLGWDWKVSAAVIAGFPAREVVIAVLGTIYAVGDLEDNSGTLSMRLKGATHPDGRPVFTLPMVIGLLLFYVFCLQCGATLAIMRRETNGWGWPLFAWVYMTGLGYLCALVAFQIGS